jgi:hypothetical protein
LFKKEGIELATGRGQKYVASNSLLLKQNLNLGEPATN